MEITNQEDFIYKKYLKPRKDAHIRVGNTYQATIPADRMIRHNFVFLFEEDFNSLFTFIFYY